MGLFCFCKKLFLFTNSRYVDRNAATITAKISTEDIKEMLQQVSTFTAKYGWEFKLPFDQQFVSKYGYCIGYLVEMYSLVCL